MIYFTPATPAAPATPTPSMAGITLPPSLDEVDGLALDPLSILITSSSSPLLSMIPASLSGADGVVVEALPFSPALGVVGGVLDVPPPLLLPGT